MVPNLLVDPVANVRETSARVAYGKVLYPATQNRIDLRNHLSDRLGPMASKYLLELVQQRRPLLALRGTQRMERAVGTQRLGLGIAARWSSSHSNHNYAALHAHPSIAKPHIAGELPCF